MKRISLWTVVFGMCLFWLSTAHAQTGLVPVFIDDDGSLGNSNIFQDSDGRIVIDLTGVPGFGNGITLDLRGTPGVGWGKSLLVLGNPPAGDVIHAECTNSPFSDDCFAISGGGNARVGVFGTGVEDGVLGISSSRIGVRGRSTSGAGGVFETSTGNILEGSGSGARRFRVDAAGNVFAATYNTGGADFAESVQPAGHKDDYEPGDVLVIDQTAARRVALAQRPYSTLVAGIYSTKPGVLASPYQMDDPRLAKEVPLAIVGIVRCKVSDENGPVKAGDLLVTSSTPGHAMKGTDRSLMLGAVVGKALEPLSSGKGVIEVLITLQ